MICATFSGVSGVSFLLATCNSSNAQTLNKRANNPIAVPFNEYSHNHSHWCHWVKVITICNFCQPSFPQNKIILHGACSALDTSLFFAFQSHLYSLYSKTQNSQLQPAIWGSFLLLSPQLSHRESHLKSCEIHILPAGVDHLGELSLLIGIVGHGDGDRL